MVKATVPTTNTSHQKAQRWSFWSFLIPVQLTHGRIAQVRLALEILEGGL